MRASGEAGRWRAALGLLAERDDSRWREGAELEPRPARRLSPTDAGCALDPNIDRHREAWLSGCPHQCSGAGERRRWWLLHSATPKARQVAALRNRARTHSAWSAAIHRHSLCIGPQRDRHALPALDAQFTTVELTPKLGLSNAPARCAASKRPSSARSSRGRRGPWRCRPRRESQSGACTSRAEGAERSRRARLRSLRTRSPDRLPRP